MTRKPIAGKHLAKGMTTVDIRTGETRPSTGTMMMMPARPGTCEWCAVNHKAEYPHDATSMFYQYRFYNEHGRWPNWVDAMGHCSEEMRQKWTDALTQQGVDVNGGGIRPCKKETKPDNEVRKKTRRKRGNAGHRAVEQWFGKGVHRCAMLKRSSSEPGGMFPRRSST